MVEELKLAIKIDDDAIEQSLLKQFNNAEKMADKVVLTFKNINLDDKNIEAKFKGMQKMAGKNPIDFSISDKSVEMLSAISKQLSNIFEIAKGKSLIDSSSTVSDIGKIANATNQQIDAVKKTTSAYKNQAYELASVLKMLEKMDKFNEVSYAGSMSKAVKANAKSYKKDDIIQFSSKDYNISEEALKQLRGLSVNLEEAFNYSDTLGLDTATIKNVEVLIQYFRELLKEKLEFNNTKLNTADIEELIKALGIAKKEVFDDGTGKKINSYDGYLNKYSSVSEIISFLKQQEQQILATAEAEQKLANVEQQSSNSSLAENQDKIQQELKETEKVAEQTAEALEKINSNGDKSNILSGNSTIEDVFQNDSDSSSIAKEESSVMKQVETATEKVTESIKRENVELENQLKILSQVGEFYTDKTVKQTIKQNDGQIIARTYRQKMEKDDEGKSYPVFDKNDNIVYDEAQDVVISNFEKLEKTIVDADNALRKMEDTKQEVLKLDQTASTSFIDEQIEDQKQYITLLEETIKKISEVKIEITDEFGNTSLENVYDIDPKAIQSAREKAAREYTLSTGVKQEKSDAKQSASDEQKRLKNIEQINRALNKQQILIDSIEKSYDKTKNIDLDKSVTDKNDLAELAQKKSEIETLINKLSGQDRNSSNEAEFLQLEKLIAEYKELAKYKLKANNPSEQKLGGTNLEVAIEQQIAQYDKLIIKAEKYGDKTSEIVENLKKQRDILTAVDGNGTHTATSDDYTNARDEYKIANAQVSSIEAQTKVAEQEAKEIQKAWDNAEEAITEYLKAKTKLNTLEATDIKSGNVKDQIDAQKQKVEELEIEAENARKVLSNLLGSQDIDTTTWNNFLKLMKDFEEAGKGSSQSIAKIKDAIANVNTSELQTIDKYIESAQKKLDSTKSGRDDSEKSSSFKIYEKEVQECIDALIAERNRLENAVKSGDIEIIDEGSLSNLNNLKQKLEDTNSEFKTMFKGSAEVSRWKEIDTITKYMEKNTRISKEAKDKLREYIETLKTNGADANVEEIHKAFLRVCDGERKAKREGQSFLDVLRDKVWYQWAAQIGSYFSLNDILNYGKQAVETIIELDTALVDLKKTTAMSSSQMEDFYFDANDVAKEMGATTKEIIEQASAWSRLGLTT